MQLLSAENFLKIVSTLLSNEREEVRNTGFRLMSRADGGLRISRCH
jgi:hypothetical protein